MVIPNLSVEDESSEQFKRAALHDAVNGLRERKPISSASVAFYPWQRNILLAILAITIACLVFFLTPTLIVLTLVCTLGYVWAMVDRLVLFTRGLDASSIVTISDQEASALSDEDLPHYTILVPAYNEPEVVGDLISAMRAIDYPSAKLQVLLLLEEDDAVTIDAATAAGVDEVVSILKVPAADPRTKPKACNYGLHFSTGEIITIYDAEDSPDPLQLRRVIATFAKLPANTACVQAKLAFHNGTQNLLTAWFTADYALWFNFILPGLMRSQSPIPLGGTSNHLRRSVLDEIGAWDPFNVTEDADLGVRIAESGYRTAVLNSTTLEEANSDTINWIRQRSRWYKGYLQTWLVHMRQPLKLWRGLGTVGFLRFTILMAGTPIVATLNMAFWLISLGWILGQPEVIHDVFPNYVYFPALVSLVFGNAAVLYMNLVACRETRNPMLLIACLTAPLYWVLMSIAAIKGTYQLIRNPSYWEKTFHGLNT
ncbi:MULTISPECIES: glycosyltransferase [Rhodococcus]|uniref:glycosyltransferase n=1 Tax=Rhodococcus TaxID=1827 RepID=UPI001E2C3449|nr:MULTISPECIES: glycosyltransferase [Rhodococcus]MCD2107724.1 glycosyltransferase [Rhodococcus qingshengii]MCZ4524827.1 glycosyltransferase [Rhodococcus erythropolis]MDV8007687.1 glycosyltransferase [Rhodococcus sp. IEGM 1318]